MKKIEYIKPEMTVVKIDTTVQVLAGSPPEDNIQEGEFIDEDGYPI